MFLQIFLSTFTTKKLRKDGILRSPEKNASHCDYQVNKRPVAKRALGPNGSQQKLLYRRTQFSDRDKERNKTNSPKCLKINQYFLSLNLCEIW